MSRFAEVCCGNVSRSAGECSSGLVVEGIIISARPLRNVWTSRNCITNKNSICIIKIVERNDKCLLNLKTGLIKIPAMNSLEKRSAFYFYVHWH